MCACAYLKLKDTLRGFLSIIWILEIKLWLLEIFHPNPFVNSPFFSRLCALTKKFLVYFSFLFLTPKWKFLIILERFGSVLSTFLVFYCIQTFANIYYFNEHLGSCAFGCCSTASSLPSSLYRWLLKIKFLNRFIGSVNIGILYWQIISKFVELQLCTLPSNEWVYLSPHLQGK